MEVALNLNAFPVNDEAVQTVLSEIASACSNRAMETNVKNFSDWEYGKHEWCMMHDAWCMSYNDR